MTNLAVFQFDSQDVRFIDGKPVANDVAKVLGYANPAKTISTKVDAENKGLTELVTPGGIQSVTVLEESGVYQLIFSSKLESAKRFQQWVFSEVLPCIRKTGQYAVTHLLPQNYLEALKALVAAEEEKQILLEHNQTMAAKIQLDAPLVAYANRVQYSDDAIDFNSFAKMIGTGRTRLFRQMREANVIMKNSTLPYQQWIDAGYFEVSQEVVQCEKDGKLSDFLQPFALVTGKGQIWLHNKLLKQEQLIKKTTAAICQGVLRLSGL